MTTFENMLFAKNIANALIDNKLAACVSLTHAESIYRWHGEKVCNNEIKMEIKTLDKHYSAIEDYLLTHHEFDNPQIIKTPITAGSSQYLNWISKQQ